MQSKIEEIVNVFVLEEDLKDLESLKQSLDNQSYNIFYADSTKTARELIAAKKFAIALIDVDLARQEWYDILTQLNFQNPSIISVLIGSERSELIALIEKVGDFYVDYFVKPFIKGSVDAKIKVYKKLHAEIEKANALINNILPEETTKEISLSGFAVPRKAEECAIFFADFCGFTKKTKKFEPNEIVNILERHFIAFDEIMSKYKIEKIKTIGDAYMAVSGATESYSHPAIRMLLGALEIKKHILNDVETQKALNREEWDLKMGIHFGDLVAGVIGKHKFSFDVWGDAVNIAARCEESSVANEINISYTFYEQVKEYIDVVPRGEISIKNAGELEMFFVKGLKPDFAKSDSSLKPNADFLQSIGLSPIDFIGLRTHILSLIRSELDDDLLYHSFEHTKRVEAAAINYATLENLPEHELILVRTAALFHDSGFLVRYNENEKIGVALMKKTAPLYGYSEEEVAIIEAIILATSHNVEPKNLMEKIMCDADHDYLGRADYHRTAEKLHKELALHGNIISDKEWLEIQLDYLKRKHRYYTNSAINLRLPAKKKRISELEQAYQLLGNATS